ncbi:MAG: phosphatidylserine decarboxylase [Anaerolineae bacterium]
MSTRHLDKNFKPTLDALSALASLPIKEIVANKSSLYLRIRKNIDRIEIEDSSQNKKSTNATSFTILPMLVPHQRGILQKMTDGLKKTIGLLPSSDVDDLKDLRDLYQTVLNRVKILNRQSKKHLKIKKIYASNFKRSLSNLEILYRSHLKERSITSMSYRNDILEAYAVALQAKKLIKSKLGFHVKRLKASSITLDRSILDRSILDRSILDRVDPFPKKLKSSHIPLFKMQDLKKVIPLMERKFFHAGKKAPTLEDLRNDLDLQKYLVIEEVPFGDILQWMYRDSCFSFLLNNSLILWLITKGTGYFYRKEMKEGKDRTKTILSFFKDLNIDVAQEVDGKLYSYRELFEKDLREEESRDKAFQRSLNAKGRHLLLKKAKHLKKSSTVISNSFCRLRALALTPQKAKEGFSITAKILNHKDPSRFTFQNMFGFENDVELSFEKAKNVRIPKDDEDAKFLYSRCLANFVERKIRRDRKAALILHRLAPPDIHHYVEPLGGKVLSLGQACKALLGQRPPLQERKQLILLKKYFKTKRIKTGFIKIDGTRMSVSTIATKYQSPLTQNHRKIMVVKHKDTIAIHEFVGATSVNNVQIEANPKSYVLGDERGAMGFGDDILEEEDSIQLCKGKKEKKHLGEAIGRFSMKGSTVVSLYFNLKLSSEIKKANKWLKYQDSEGVIRRIEIKAQMGDPLGHIQ